MDERAQHDHDLITAHVAFDRARQNSITMAGIGLFVAIIALAFVVWLDAGKLGEVSGRLSRIENALGLLTHDPAR